MDEIDLFVLCASPGLIWLIDLFYLRAIPADEEDISGDTEKENSILCF